MWRVLKTLIYKNYLVRRRQWKSTLLLEICFPVLLILFLCFMNYNIMKDLSGMNNSRDKIWEAESISQYYGYKPDHISYSPNDGSTKNLMSGVKACTNITDDHGYPTEKDLLDNSNSTIALIFENGNVADLKHLSYKIRAKNLNMAKYHLEQNYVLKIQACVAQSFMKVKNRPTELGVKIQEVPEPALPENFVQAIFRKNVVPQLIFVALSISLFAESLRASKEKFIGVNVLLSMNGVSTAVSLLSWIISGGVFIFLFVAIPTIVMGSMEYDSQYLFFYHGNVFIIGLVFLVHIPHLLMFGLHVSAYFTKAITVTFGLMLVSYGPVTFRYVLEGGWLAYLPFLGILFPGLLFYRAIEEIEYYEMISKDPGIGFKNLFEAGDYNYGFTGSVGMVVILSVIGFVFHFFMAIYIYAINPGKYGTKSHPLFFFYKFLNKSSAYLDEEYVEKTDEKLFEAVNEEIYRPAIQIRNLRKTYKIGFINQSEVNALRGVSIDFYKGQITALLGHNGAGKSTCMSILSGMTSPSGGLVLVGSKDLRTHGNEIRNDIGLCPQENMMFPNLSLREQLLIFAMLKGQRKTQGQIEQSVTALLSDLKLYEKRHALPSKLSGGQKRRLCLGMSVIGDTSTIILDEPTSGLDPENRRVIWDILLKMKGQKTIIISTHDMEEADILGDRIAIMHTGQLRSYGTSFFLKKILGDGNVQVNLSVEPWCDSQRIIGQFGSDTKVVNEDGGKLVLSIKSKPQLPDLLDSVESRKKELGITGLGVSLLTLEQVFLKVTQEDDGSKSCTSFDGSSRFSSDRNYWQIMKGLFCKKMTYLAKNVGVLLGMLFFTIITVVWIYVIINHSWVESPQLIRINLDRYVKPETFYKTRDSTIGNKYKAMSESSSGKATEVKDKTIVKALLDYGRRNLDLYESYVVAGMDYNSSEEITALYNDKLDYSVPLSINLATNAILKSMDDDLSIDLSIQNIENETQYSKDYWPYLQLLDVLTAAVLTLFLLPIIILFVLQPLRESLTHVKHLQRITGASGSTYWGTMFVFDLTVFFILIALIMIGAIAVNYILDLHLYYTQEILLSILLFGLFAISSLPFVYVFSFTNKEISTVVRLIFYFTVFLVITDAVAFGATFFKKFEFLLKIQKYVYYLFPQISFMRGQVSFLTTMKLNARCRSLPSEAYSSKCNPSGYFNFDICCTFGCKNGECTNYKPFFNIKGDKRFNGTFEAVPVESYFDLAESLISLSVTPIIYFLIIAILESKLIEKWLARRKEAYITNYPVDEQVKEEKNAVATIISRLRGNNTTYDYETVRNNNTAANHTFLVHELQKRYGELQAVKDVTFRVKERECFGLLGVNGSGKSTTFRMMTGHEVLDHGIMYMGDKDFENNKNYFLSRMGYCPQNDALIESLNSYDHLRLFARLRGIPENQVENEIQLWIERLNLKRCAKQPSGTYSGGNKRRLNIAIALIGIPDLVLMDEPTTGVDPGARRSLWSVIQSCQATGQAVILTSHSMEECEALCNRLAIMVDGKFVCTGASQELKQRFGTDYNIQIKMDAGKSINQVERLKEDMKKLLDCEVADENMGYIMYLVKPTKTSWKQMYDVMNGLKNKYDCIDDFTVSSSTLEQLFLHFAKSAQNRSA